MYTYWWYWRVITKKSVVSWCFSENLGSAHFLYTVEWEVHLAKTCLVVLFLGGSFDSTQNHRNLFFCWEAVPNFCWKPHQNSSEWKTPSSFPPRSSKLLRSCRWRLHRRHEKSWIDAWPFWAFSMQVSQILLSHIFHPCRKQAFKPLAWICVKIWLNWSFCTTSLLGPSMLHVISDLVSSWIFITWFWLKVFSQRTQLSNTWAELRSNEISIFLDSRAAWPETDQKAELFFWWTLTSERWF